MNAYQTRKEKAREEAIIWQSELPKSSYSYIEIELFHDYFRDLGKRYGLLKEFRENGII